MTGAKWATPHANQAYHEGMRAGRRAQGELIQSAAVNGRRRGRIVGGLIGFASGAATVLLVRGVVSWLRG